jgi:hypothetical protein
MIGCKCLPVFSISNQKKGEESKIAERQRESVCVREAEHCGRREIASAIKWTVRE